jgi:uncharacterized 2Fe-2S/4Fe-4S cluster protein (DUF4445 family)
LFIIDFQPIGRRGECASDQSLLECARQLSVDIVSICGGVGNCERCKVQVISGEVTRLTLDEAACLSKGELEQGIRLACQAYPLSDVRLHVPPESLTALQRTQVEGLEVDVEPDSFIRSVHVSLEPPTLESPAADDHSLWAALAEQGIPHGRMDLPVMQSLAVQLRQNGWQASLALREAEIVAVGARNTRWLGLAVDIGTTKIAGYLVDLESGRTLASKGLMNPQIAYGEDVISRIVAASRTPAEAQRLQTLLTEALNQMVVDLCTEVQAKPEDIADAVIVGNTAIHHLLLRLPVAQLGFSPYVPAVSAPIDIKAREIGLHIAPGANIHLLANIAGFVGADHVAMLLATRIVHASGTVLAIDIGTNTEICLNHNGKLTSVSCASGPAFEGAHIKFGMRAAPGAIEHVRMTENRLETQTIGGEPPVGICGSGLLDAVAQLYSHGILNRSGKMGVHPRVRQFNGATEFVLISQEQRHGQDAITISQKDVRELQLAKAAIRLGIQALVEAEGLEEDDIEQVIIAGAFGTFIDVSSAITIAMLPPLPLERFKQVGNAAGTGARLALISRAQREQARHIADQDGYIELAQMPGFQRKFAEATYLK